MSIVSAEFNEEANATVIVLEGLEPVPDETDFSARDSPDFDVVFERLELVFALELVLWAAALFAAALAIGSRFIASIAFCVFFLSSRPARDSPDAESSPWKSGGWRERGSDLRMPF